MSQQYLDCIPIITVRDLATAKRFYLDVLGFQLDFDGPDVVGLLRDRVQFYLIVATSQNRRQDPGTGNLVVLVEEVDSVFETCIAAGAEIIIEPDDRPYGQRDFALRDPDGNVLVFAAEVS